MANIKNELREFIVENFLFGDTETHFSDSDSFMDAGIIDSTGILEVITFIEENYNVKVEDDEILPENLDSLDNLDNFINKKS